MSFSFFCRKLGSNSTPDKASWNSGLMTLSSLIGRGLASNDEPEFPHAPSLRRASISDRNCERTGDKEDVSGGEAVDTDEYAGGDSMAYPCSGGLSSQAPMARTAPGPCCHGPGSECDAGGGAGA